MKKLIVGLAIAASVGFAAPASADCSLVPCGNGDPFKVVQIWGLNGYETPKVAPGTKVFDYKGRHYDTCPIWYFTGCFDIGMTDYYKVHSF